MEFESRITGSERQAAIDQLNSTRERFTATLMGVSEEQARFKPSPERWSILELVEHMAAGDAGILGAIGQALASPAQPELVEQARARDHRFFAEFKPLPRGVNKAPDGLRPRNTYSSLAEAAAAFEESRSKTITYARETDAELRNHFFPHSVFGPMDCYQWLVACARHSESHALQIDELKADPNYPTR